MDLVKDLQNIEKKGRFRRRQWEPIMKKYDMQRVCEVGVFNGDHFKLMIAHEPELAVAVDLWRDDGIPSQNDTNRTQEFLDDLYRRFEDDMSVYPFVRVIRDFSTKACDRFPDNFFDLIYIDADHSYEGCLADIKAWYPKMKSGCALTGDDYRHGKTKAGTRFGVIKAVQTFIKNNKLEDNFFEFPWKGWGIIKP